MNPRTTALVVALLAAGCGDGAPGTNAGTKNAASNTSGFVPLDPDKTKTTETGLKVQEIDAGTGNEVKTGDSVEVHYTGWLKDGKKFDSSWDRGKPIRVTVGAGGVIKGWDEGLVGLKEGGRRKLEIPHALAYGENGRPPVIPPAATLVFELDLVRIAPGVKKEDIKVGDGAEAKPGDTVEVHYTGRLTNGKQFDSSVGKQPFRFRLGAREVIQGWDEGVAGMKVGGKRKLTVPPDLGYGAQGAPPDIPPDATLVFDVELLKVDASRVPARQR